MLTASVACAAEAYVSKPNSDTPGANVSSTHIRTLASSCAACHGTNGNSASGDSAGTTPSISHIDKSLFMSEMFAFRSGERPATVMHRHAKGLTNQEIEDLAEYFSKQPRQTIHAIPSQRLSKDYPN